MPTTVSIAAINDAVEGGTAGTFRFTRSDTTGFLSVNATASGTEGVTDQTAVFLPGSNTTDVLIMVTNDSTSEPTKTVTLTVATGTGYTPGTPGTATIEVLDDDADVVSVAAVADATEGGSAGTLRFTRTGSLASSITVNYTVGGTATSGTDFTSLSGSVTIAANAASADATVTPAADNVVEDGGETVTLTATSGTGYTVGTPSSGSITIVDNPPVVVVVWAADAVEGGASGTFQVIRSGGNMAASLAVTYNVGGTATSGSDFTALSGSVTIAATATYANVSVSAANDLTADPGESVILYVIDGGASYTVGTPAATSLTILDASTGIIKGRAWNDTNSDGIQDTGEDGLSEVTVTLYDGTTQVAVTHTDADGTYSFSGITPGSNYQVKFVALPSDNATLSAQDQGSDDTIDSDPNATTALSGALVVGAGTTVDHLDAGFRVAPVAASATISFYDGDNGYILAMTLTTSDGTHSFGPLKVYTHSAKDARAIVFGALAQLGWDVSIVGDTRLKINGFIVNGNTNAVQSLNYTLYTPTIDIASSTNRSQPRFDPGGAATVTGGTSNSQPGNPNPQSLQTVWISFSADSGYDLTLVIETDNNVTATFGPYRTNGASRTAVRNDVYTQITTDLGADWIIDQAGTDSSFVIRGKTVGGNVDRVKKVTMTYTLSGSIIPPLATGVGGATVVVVRQ